jgi:hypothetical protein
MPVKAPVFKHFSTQISVTNIRIIARTPDGRRVCKADADVMEHGCFRDKCNVGIQMRQAPGNVNGLAGHGRGMGHENIISE